MWVAANLFALCGWQPTIGIHNLFLLYNNDLFTVQTRDEEEEETNQKQKMKQPDRSNCQTVNKGVVCSR